MYDKLRREAKSRIEDEHQDDDGNENTIDENGAVASLELSDSNGDGDGLMQYFKNCVVHQNRNELKEKMKTSLEFRRNLLKNPKVAIYKMFPFYFVDPTLVTNIIKLSE